MGSGMNSVTRLPIDRESRCGHRTDLAALGVDRDEARTYLLLLARPSMTVAELARELEALVARRQTELNKARLAISQLNGRARRGAARRGVAEELERSWSTARSRAC